MRTRRAFISALGTAAAAWPLAARAQQPAKLPTIGVLGSSSRSVARQWLAAFVKRLGELGWNDGRTVAMEVRWSDGSTARSVEFIAEFVRGKVDVIVTTGSANVIAAKQATSLIPIVFAGVGDPISTGVIASLARPGGNATGLSLQQPDTAGKRLGLLREVLPNLDRLAIMGNVSAPSVVREMREVQEAARALAVDLTMLEIRRSEDVALAFDKLKQPTQALYVVTDPLVTANLSGINTLALSARLATIHGFREYVEAGGLMSYGADFTELWRRAADFVDKILRGAKPGDIPVEQPTKFDLVVNLTTAKALGLTVPPTLLARADEVIE
jgi:putative tryptophan/tyrosine transport system substrate-binding protein